MSGTNRISTGQLSGPATTFYLDADLISQSIAGNYSVVRCWLRNVSGPSGATTGSNYSNTGYQIGLLNGGEFGRIQKSPFLQSGFGNGGVRWDNYYDVVVAHNADGTGHATLRMLLSYGNISRDLSAGLGLPTIPRASTPTFTVDGVAATAVDAGDTVTINTNRASTGFTHTATWKFGTQSGTIGTGITTSTTWTPPLSLLTEIPTAASGAMQITLTTFSGSTNVGSKVVNLTLRVPSTVGPDFTTVTHAEATAVPNVAGLIGAYVKDFSRLAVAITGAVGAYGSTVTGYKIEVASQIINAASGTTGVIGQSGSLVLRGTVTDSRGSTKVKDVPITVLNYNPPTIATATAVRTTVGGTVEPDGTYIKVDVTAVVQSLIVGTQRNNLLYKIKTRANDDETAWASIAPVVSGSAGATGYADDSIIGTYPVSQSYTVRVEVSDVLGSLAVVELTVSTGGTLVHFSKTFDGFGVGKYHEQGSIDAKEQMFQNDGEIVVDMSMEATNISRGVVELATLAEVAALTDGVRAVTPASLAPTVGRITSLEQWSGANRPAFHVRHAGTFAVSGAQTETYMNFNTVVANQGGHWKPATFQFVAPVDGLYHFEVSITNTGITGGPEAGIYKNGVFYMYMAIAYYHYVTATGSIKMPLVAGDVIRPVFRNNNATSVAIDGTRSYFSGMLLV